MTETTRFPLDWDALKKGDVIAEKVVVEIVGVRKARRGKGQ